MFRATISLPEEQAEYLEKTGRKTSEALSDIIADYRYARLYGESKLQANELVPNKISAEEREYLENYLEEEVFKVERLFDAENNQERAIGMVAVVQLNGEEKMPFVKELGIFCIDQFIQMSDFCRKKYGNRYFFKKCLCERMVEDYLDENQRVQLKEYRSRLKEADKLELKIKKDEIQEIFAYKDGELIDYFLGNDSRLPTYKNRIERLTGAEWKVTDKEDGNTDCSLVRMS